MTRPAPHRPHPALPGCRPRTLARLRLLALALLLAPALAACGGTPPPEGDLRGILDEYHEIADPGILGASATGRGCDISRAHALTKAQRVAQFNLRSLTGNARYKVRFDLVSQSEDAKGFCVEMSATAIAPRPYVR